MPAKPNSHHIVDFALHEVGPFPEIGERLHRTVGFGDAGFETDAMPLSDRIKLVDYLEPFLIVRPVDRADMHDIVEVHGRIVAQELGDLVQFVFGDRDRQVSSPLYGLDETDGEVFLDPICQLLERHAQAFSPALTCSGCLTNTRFCMMRSCSLSTPSKSASGVGGQPGT